MRILFLAPQPFFEARGTPINVRNMVTALSELGHEVDLLVYPHGDNVDIPNVRIHRVIRIPGLGKAPIGPSKEKVIYDAAMMIHAFTTLVRGKYDAIHAVEDAAFMAWPLSWLFGVPFVFDMDSIMSDQLRYSRFMRDGFLLKAFERMESAALRSASMVITVCGHLTEAAALRVDRSKIFQIEDTPMTGAPPPGLAVEKLRAELGLPEGCEPVVYTGNLEKYQGIDLLLDSAVEVAREHPSVRIVVVGGSGADVEKYKAKAGAMGLGANVVFAGPKPPETMPTYYELADILVSPRIEGTNTPLKIYTYLDTGKPVVATDLPTHTQALNRDVAMLARPEKMEFARAILLLLNDKGLRRALGDRGREYVRSNFSYASFRKKLEEAYKHIR
ncbi:MAG: glycosyltransferase family 4 protein [Nitrospinae bacterium]|nr:glycosyltransferase family 4 protein [Nitrospinota bacterium]